MRKYIAYFIFVFIFFTFIFGGVYFFKTSDKAQNNKEIYVSSLFPELRVKNDNEDLNMYTVELMGLCLKEIKTEKCYQELAKVLISQFDLSVIMKALEETEDYHEVFSKCHTETHFLGREGYRLTGNLSDSFNQCNFTCHGGCYHGVMEQFFVEEGLVGAEEKQVKKILKTACGKEENYPVFQEYGECIHGLGHASMLITGTNLVLSLGFCDELGSVSEREACYSGVFMENSSSSTETAPHPTNFIKKEDPMYPCNILEEKYLNICYGYQSSYFYQLSGSDWQGTVDLCNQVPEDYRHNCFTVYGSNQVGNAQDMSVWVKNCRLIKKEEYQDVCISGIVNSLAGRYGGDYEKLTNFCAILEGLDKKHCYLNIANVLSSFGFDNEDIKSMCLKFKEYSFACLEQLKN